MTDIFSTSIAGQWCGGEVSKIIHTRMTVDDRSMVHIEGVLSAPLQSFQIDARLGNTPRVLRFAAGGFFSTEDNAAIDALAQHFGQEVFASAAKLDHSWRWVMLAVAVMMLLGIMFVMYGMPALAKAVAFQVPLNMQQRLGEETLSLLDKTWLEPSKADAGRQARITQAFNALVKDSRWQGETHLLFRALPDKVANAFALPDGTIVVSDGLLDITRHDAEIVAVLAHEMGHLERRHALRHMLQSMGVGLLIVIVAGDTSPLVPVLAGLPAVLLDASYSRAFERESDRFAAQLLRRRGDSRNTFIDILRRLERSQPKGVQVPVFLSTHPVTDERIENYLAAWDEAGSLLP